MYERACMYAYVDGWVGVSCVCVNEAVFVRTWAGGPRICQNIIKAVLCL